MAFVQNGTCSDENVLRGTWGPVGDDETLARIVKRPEHFDSKGQVKPGLFPRSHITKTGLSVTRMEKIQNIEFATYAHAVAEMKFGQKLAGVRKVLTSRIRQIRDENLGRAFCVIEDPEPAFDNVPANEAHAVAITSLPLEQEDEIIRLQMELAKAFSELAPI